MVVCKQRLADMFCVSFLFSFGGDLLAVSVPKLFMIVGQVDAICFSRLSQLAQARRLFVQFARFGESGSKKTGQFA